MLWLLIGIGIGIYLGIGAVVILLFERKTRRISRRFSNGVDSVQVATITGRREAVVLLSGALVLFWPALLYGWWQERRKAGSEPAGNQQ